MGARISPLRRIRELAPYVPGLSIAEIQAKYGLSQVIKLASNENPLGASPLAREAIGRAAASAFRYPAGGNPRLREALGAMHGVNPALIAVGNGSDEILDLLIRMLAREGEDNIVCFDPCFSIYPIQARIAGVEVRRQRLDADFSFNPASLLGLVDSRTRLVFITTPDNPSGYCPPLKNVRDFAAKLAQSAPQALLAVDEAYIDFAEGEKDFSLLANHILPENVAFCRTCSKSWGLAGLRLGYAVLPDKLADAFWRARLPFSVNILAEEAALAAFRDRQFREATLKAVREGRRRLREGLSALACRVWPSSANFLMFTPPEGTLTASRCLEALLRQGIIIRGLKSYGLPGHLRVSVGNAHENAVFLTAMARVLES